MIPERHRTFVENLLAKHGVRSASAEGDAGRYLLGWTDATGRPQVEVALRHPIALLANALGPPPADVVEQAHRQGVAMAALASSPRHADKQVNAGVDIIVAQGTEAGGHTGVVSTMVVVPEIVDAVAPRPVRAAGALPMPLQCMLISDARRRVSTAGVADLADARRPDRGRHEQGEAGARRGDGQRNRAHSRLQARRIRLAVRSVQFTPGSNARQLRTDSS